MSTSNRFESMLYRLLSGESAKSLLETNADLLTYKNSLGETLFHYLLTEGEVDIAMQLHDLGSKVDESNKYGESPLVSCILAKQFDSVRYLLDNDANPNSKTSFGEPILIAALESGNLDGASLLLLAGAKKTNSELMGQSFDELLQKNSITLERLKSRMAFFKDEV